MFEPLEKDLSAFGPGQYLGIVRLFENRPNHGGFTMRRQFPSVHQESPDKAFPGRSQTSMGSGTTSSAGSFCTKNELKTFSRFFICSTFTCNQMSGNILKNSQSRRQKHILFAACLKLALVRKQWGLTHFFRYDRAVTQPQLPKGSKLNPFKLTAILTSFVMWHNSDPTVWVKW